MTTTPIRHLILPLVLALAASACGVFSDDGLTVYAEFGDSMDLVTGAHVRAGDVPIGTVTAIELTDELQARVTMDIEEDTGLPAETAAELAKTSMLGERFIDLRPIGDTGALQDGQTIEQTRVVTDFEDLVEAGGETLAFVAADRLAAAVETGAVAFGGRGSVLGQLLADIEGFVGTYEGGKDDLVRLIDSLDELTAALAPDADVNAEGLAVLERASRTLQEEDDRLLDALDDLTRLSVVGERIMREHRTEIDNAIRRLRIVLSEITRVDGALQRALTWLPRHNVHVPNGITDEHAQVWLDFIICGEQDVEGDPSRDCTPPNPNEKAESPPYHPTSEECWEDHEHCEGTQRDEQETSP